MVEERRISSLRLIAGATAPSGKQRAGVQIMMSPGYKTYWRSPGDVGVPPVFDWSGSENIGGLDVLAGAGALRGRQRLLDRLCRRSRHPGLGAASRSARSR